MSESSHYVTPDCRGSAVPGYCGRSPERAASAWCKRRLRAPDSTASVHSVTKSSISRESASGASSGTQCPHRATTSARTLTATRSSDGPQFLRDGVFIVCGILQPRAIVCKVTAERARCPIAAQVLLGVVTGDCRRIVVRGCRDAWETQNATSRPPLRSSSRILRSRLRRA